MRGFQGEDDLDQDGVALAKNHARTQPLSAEDLHGRTVYVDADGGNRCQRGHGLYFD